MSLPFQSDFLVGQALTLGVIMAQTGHHPRSGGAGGAAAAIELFLCDSIIQRLPRGGRRVRGLAPPTGYLGEADEGTRADGHGRSADTDGNYAVVTIGGGSLRIPQFGGGRLGVPTDAICSGANRSGAVGTGASFRRQITARKWGRGLNNHCS